MMTNEEKEFFEEKNVEKPIEEESLNGAPQDGVDADDKKANKKFRKELKADAKKIARMKEEAAALEKKVAELSAALAKEKEDYVRLLADFDNYRRRTSQERLDLVASASEDTIKGLLPVLDDFERAMLALENSEDSPVAKEGTALIYNKLMTFLKSKGLSAIGAKFEKFDTDIHEAVSQFPVAEENMKGCVFDVIQTGYKLNGKVIRYSKVVVGI